MTTVTTKLQIRRVKAGRKRLVEGPSPDVSGATGRVPRISRLMALAIKFQGMLREGLVKDQSELARLARVSQPRMTQIMNLTFLAPDIQATILFLRLGLDAEDVVSLRNVQRILLNHSWQMQRSSAITAGLPIRS